MGMWNETSRKAAYERFGQNNYGWLILWHALPKLLAVGVLVGVLFLARAGWRALQSQQWPGWPDLSALDIAPALPIAGAALAVWLLYRWLTRHRRRGYRITRSRY